MRSFWKHIRNYKIWVWPVIAAVPLITAVSLIGSAVTHEPFGIFCLDLFSGDERSSSKQGHNFRTRDVEELSISLDLYEDSLTEWKLNDWLGNQNEESEDVEKTPLQSEEALQTADTEVAWESDLLKDKLLKLELDSLLSFDEELEDVEKPCSGSEEAQTEWELDLQMEDVEELPDQESSTLEEEFTTSIPLTSEVQQFNIISSDKEAGSNLSQPTQLGISLELSFGIQ